MKSCLNQVKKEKEILRCAWSPKEDAAIFEAIMIYKGERWNLIAKHVQKSTLLLSQLKTAKQCRERWNNQLNPKIDLGTLTEEEIKELFRLHKKFGNSWSKISKCMDGRIDNIIKNYFMCRLRRLARNVKRRNLQEAVPKDEDDLFHTLYLLDYLYKYYISSEKSENIRKNLTAQTLKRKNKGDRYINKAVINDGAITSKLACYTKALINSSTFHVDKNKLEPYQYLMALKNNTHTLSFCAGAYCEDQKTLSILMFNKIAIPSAREVIDLPLPNWNKKLPADDFKPTFIFAAYSTSSLSNSTKEGWNGESS
jgi:hypothetical protein